MNSFKNNKRNKLPLNINALLIFFSIVLIVLSYFNFFKLVPIFDIFTVPVEKYVNDNKSSFEIFLTKFENNSDLASDNLDLRKKIIEKDIQIDNLKFVQTEIDSLRKLNQIIIPQKNKILARNISLSLQDKLPSKITIDKGEIDGIKEGQDVFNDTGSLIGKINSVKKFTADIVPYYLLDSQKVTIKSSATPNAVVDTQKNGVVTCINTSQNNNIKVGDLFFTSSLGTFAPDIYVGKVSKIDLDDNKRFYLDTDIQNNSILFINI